MSCVNLPYINEDIDLQKTKHYFTVSADIDHYYKGASIRNRVILKLDVMSGLTECFDVDTLSSKRSVVYSLVAGRFEKCSMIAEVFKALYFSDATFHNYVGSKFYFDMDAYKDSLYNITMLGIIQEYRRLTSIIEDESVNCDYKLLLESNGFYYISVRDLKQDVYLPSGFKEEVLSSARVWGGVVKRQECQV